MSPIGAVRYEGASGGGGDSGERDGGCGRIGADRSQGGRKDGQEVIFELLPRFTPFLKSRSLK